MCRTASVRRGRWGGVVKPPPPDPQKGPRPAPTITFFVAGDSHFGAPGMEALNRAIVEQMNALPGTEYPPAIGGQVETPRGVLFMGDMTDSSQETQWRQFARAYGHTGKDGQLRFPVYEALGNHDIIGDSPVARHVKRRHGSLTYSWDWSDLHLICLDTYPDARTRAWLVKDLAKVGRQRPLLIFFHYAIEGPYSDFWPEADKQALAQSLDGYNVLAIFHGHFHHVGRYEWRGHTVFLPGSPRHSSHEFLVARLSADTLSIASWDFDNRRWRDAFVKPIRR
jgi:cytolysin (calcineurin-like family phosphatase)